jgi:uncharacterized membrane protein HdeD (DUF308 family)
MTPRPPRDPAWVNRICCVYAVMLGAYPKVFRIEFGYEMQQVFRDRCRAAAATQDLHLFAGLMFWDWLRSSIRERLGDRRGLEIHAGQALIKGWWLLALCGIIDAISAMAHLLRLSPEGRSSVWDLGVLSLAAGACAIAAGFWNSGRGNSWLLALHGLGLSAFGLIAVSPLVRGPLSFRPISLLFVLMAVTAAAAALRTAHQMRSRARDIWVLVATGTALLGFACSFPAVAFGLVRLQSPNSYWIWMSAYFGVTALCLLSIAMGLHATERPQTAEPRPWA